MSSDVEPMGLCDTKQTLQQILDKGRNAAAILGDMIVSLEDHVAQDFPKSVITLQNILSKAQCDLTHKLNAFGEDPPLPVNSLRLKDAPCHGTVAITAEALEEAGMPPMSIYQDSGHSDPLSFTQTAVPNASTFTSEDQLDTRNTENPPPLATPNALHARDRNTTFAGPRLKKQKGAKRVLKGRNARGTTNVTTVQARRFSGRLASRKNHVIEADTGTYVDDQENDTVEKDATAAVTPTPSDVEMHEFQDPSLPAACNSTRIWKAVEDHIPLTPTHLRVQDNSTTRGLKCSTDGAIAVASGRVEKRRPVKPMGVNVKKGGRGPGGKKGSKK